MSQSGPRLTAAQVILLAGDDLMAQGAREFTEWDLTVAAWGRERTRFGLRGYDQKHPDHKRVMMEIMGHKPQNPITLGFMEKVQPNIYRLTPLGRAEAARLRSGGAARAPLAPSLQPDLYGSTSALLNHPIFTAWKNDPDQPRRWADAQTFLNLGGDPNNDPGANLAHVREAARAAREWCQKHDVHYITSQNRGHGEPIHMSDITALNDFLRAIEYRFEEHFATTTPPTPPKKKVKS
jgi:hypothetical protein